MNQPLDPEFQQAREAQGSRIENLIAAVMFAALGTAGEVCERLEERKAKRLRRRQQRKTV